MATAQADQRGELAQAGVRQCFVVPHTHWDREWYRPFEHFQLRLAGVVDQLLEVLEGDPGFTSFTLDGQAIVLEDYLDARPENEGRLRKLIAAGRIEVGPSYVLPDELLVSAEALVRNLLIGRAVCERFGAVPAAVGYLPDSFGHPLQLPQILAGFGIENLIFSRGLGDQLDEVGLAFRWQAPDGSEVLALQQLPDYGNFAALAGADDAERRVRWILGQFSTALHRAGVHALLLCNGTDHVPVQPELPGWCAELERRFPGTRFTISRYAEYIAELVPDRFPSWSGELVDSRLQNVLRGVNSARLYIKQADERAQQRLLAVETLAALASLHGGAPFPQADFDLAWRRLLKCHPHDSICGCSCDEVHRDMLVRYELLDRVLSELERRSIEGLAREAGAGTGGSGAGRQVGVLNPLPYRRRRLLELPGAEPVLVELDGFAADTIKLPLRAPLSSDPSSAGTAIESDCIRAEAAPGGTVTILDKRTGRRFVGLHSLEDELDCGDLYTFCPVEGTHPWRSEAAAVRVLADGPLVWELELRVQAERPAGIDAEGHAALRATTIVRLVRGSGRVEFRTTIDNAARDHRLRAIFPIGTNLQEGAGPDPSAAAQDRAGPEPSAGAAPQTVRAEGQFAAVHRPLVPPRPLTEWAEPPNPTQHTAGAVAFGRLALITKGLPEYEARSPDGRPELCLTLLRCVGVISRPAGLASRPRCAGPPVSTPEGQCVGTHELEYALLLDGDGLDDAALLRASQDYRCDFLVSDHAVELEPPLALDGDVVFSCLKGAQDGDGLILRCFNPGRSAASARVAGVVAVSRVRLDETGEQPLADGVVPLRAGEVATLRLRRGSD